MDNDTRCDAPDEGAELSDGELALVLLLRALNPERREAVIALARELDAAAEA